MFTCDSCDKKFDRKYNMLRHKQVKHHQENLDSEIMDQNSNTSDTDEEIDDPMDRLVDEVFKQFQPIYEKQVMDLINRQNISEEEARDKTYNTMKKYLSQSSYRRIYRQYCVVQVAQG